MKKYKKIAQIIKSKILNGEWKAGEKVLSLRHLTRKYKVSNNTIMLALRNLKDEGYLFSVPAVGYFVKEKNEHKVDKHMKTILKSYYNAETKSLGAINFSNTELLSKYMSDNFISFLFKLYKKQEDSSKHLTYLCGNPSLISTLSDFLEKDNIFVFKENIIITSNPQLTIEMINRMFSEKNKLTVALSNSSHYNIISIFEKLVNIKEIELLEDGWNFKEFEKLLSNEKIDFVYVTPNFHEPSGICWSKTKKNLLLELAEKYDFYIIEEDNYSSLFCEEEYISLKSLERIGKERVFYIRDFSALLGSVVGITCVIIPPKFRENFLVEKAIFSISPSKIQQKILENIITSGYLEFFLEKYRKILFHRTNYLINMLKEISELDIVKLPKGGFFIWLKLSSEIDENTFYELCLKNNLLILPGYIFYKDIKNEQKFRLSFACTSINEIKLGINKIKEIIKSLKTNNHYP
ncbi:PLP-dependent aminotransferase family protein [Fusobacterium russii]|uniref:aminotransferase-like domain-containing protein n=1 Tax=Fusobacterium russii TaxID=854 RepID=UPI00039A356F|nr:PLP-dependent aminotransferase family protein [Fusobacterium russii]